MSINVMRKGLRLSSGMPSSEQDWHVAKLRGVVALNVGVQVIP